MKKQGQEILRFQVEKLRLEVYPSGEAAGAAAAQAAADTLRRLAAIRESIGVIFATGTSQIAMLRALITIPEMPWDRVRGFHMDDYIGIPADHPASFRRYLREKLTQQVQMKEFLEINGTAPDLDRMGRDYTEALRSSDPQLCLLGIGENGHLAFNDPDEAKFCDPLDMKIVHLDTACRKQQAAEGWFKSFQEVPARAITLTIPALFRVPKLIVSVPGSRKARIMRRTLQESISMGCPSTILRTHPNATVYLDEESAAELSEMGTLAGAN